jgi:hypothetical protein
MLIGKDAVTTFTKFVGGLYGVKVKVWPDPKDEFARFMLGDRLVVIRAVAEHDAMQAEAVEVFCSDRETLNTLGNQWAQYVESILEDRESE